VDIAEQGSVQRSGKLSYDAKAAAVAPNPEYDIASLTKVVATTTLVAEIQRRATSPCRSLPWREGRAVFDGAGPAAER